MQIVTLLWLDSITPSGEIMATRSIITDWSMINCTNQTEIYEEKRYRLNIANSSSDGINDTFKIIPIHI